MTADLGVLWQATPYLTADLHPSSSQLLWTTDMYGFMTAGFHTASLVSAALALVTALAVTALLRHIPPIGSPDH